MKNAIAVHVELKATTDSVVSLRHTGGVDPVDVWESRSLMLDVDDTILMVTGRVAATGYAQVELEIDGKVVYPTRRHRCPFSNGIVSITVLGACSSNISEYFACSDRDRDRVLFARYRKGYELAVNSKAKSRYVELMSALTEKYTRLDE